MLEPESTTIGFRPIYGGLLYHLDQAEGTPVKVELLSSERKVTLSYDVPPTWTAGYYWLKLTSNFETVLDIAEVNVEQPLFHTYTVIAWEPTCPLDVTGSARLRFPIYIPPFADPDTVNLQISDKGGQLIRSTGFGPDNSDRHNIIAHFEVQAAGVYDVIIKVNGIVAAPPADRQSLSLTCFDVSNTLQEWVPGQPQSVFRAINYTNMNPRIAGSNIVMASNTASRTLAYGAATWVWPNLNHPDSGYIFAYALKGGGTFGPSSHFEIFGPLLPTRRHLRANSLLHNTNTGMEWAAWDTSVNTYLDQGSSNIDFGSGSAWHLVLFYLSGGSSTKKQLRIYEDGRHVLKTDIAIGQPPKDYAFDAGVSLATSDSTSTITFSRIVTCPSTVQPQSKSHSTLQMYFSLASKPAYDSMVLVNPSLAYIIQDPHGAIPVAWKEDRLHFHTQAMSVRDYRQNTRLPVVLTGKSACVQYRFGLNNAGSNTAALELVGNVSLRIDASPGTPVTMAYYYTSGSRPLNATDPTTDQVTHKRMEGTGYNASPSLQNVMRSSPFMTVTVIVSSTNVSVWEDDKLVVDDWKVVDASTPSFQSTGNACFNVAFYNSMSTTVDVGLAYIRVISGLNGDGSKRTG